MIYVYGNCQARGISNCLSLLLPHRRFTLRFVGQDNPGFEKAETVFVHAPFVQNLEGLLDEGTTIVRLPAILFTGFHPDMIHYPNVNSPTGSTSVRAPIHRTA
ncbi:MAG: hypothetical protein IPL38_14745 [Rhodobacter sp.]|nr:hypothetical protein [Rhodobacter sp.]